jgi:hypothetical protein
VVDPSLARFLGVSVGTVLLVASGAKVLGDSTSAESFLRGVGVPPWASQPLVRIATGVEGVLGAVLVSGLAPIPSSAAATGLFLLFLIAQGRHARNGGRTGCKCFGALDAHMPSQLALWRVVVLTALAATSLSVFLFATGSGKIAVGALPAVLGALFGIAILSSFAHAAAVAGFLRSVGMARAALQAPAVPK